MAAAARGLPVTGSPASAPSASSPIVTSEHFRLRSHPRTALAPTLRALSSLVDWDVGVIQSIDWYTPKPDEPRLVHCHVTLADVGKITGRQCSRATGGTALTEEVALAKAIGESVERYCADLGDSRDVLNASFNSLGADAATDPARFALYHPRQYSQRGFPFVPPDARTVIGWVEGYSLTRDVPTLVPAGLVHLSYPWRRDECFDMGPVSGYACGNTLEEAVLSAICEVIERDAFMVSWYNRLPVPAFELRAAQSDALRETLDRYHATPARLHCTNITSDVGIPVACAVMVSRQPGWPAAVVATAAHLDPEQAIVRALHELAANHLYIRSYFENPHGRRPQSPHEVVTPEDHGLFYCAPAQLPLLDLLVQPRWSVRPSDIIPCALSDDVKANVEYCLERLAALDLEVIVVDLTTPDVDSLGLKVVKVLIPGTQPLDFGTRWQHLGGRRLYETPVRMGYRRTPPQVDELNRLPHPFP
jgi:ribosomal protein S12 methylthiotransferase accessory factor